MFGHPGAFTAALCSDDRPVTALLSAMAARGLKCPEDLSILCWNNRASLNYASPPISRFEIPVEGMGRNAAQLILNALAGGEAVHSVLLEEPFVEKDSISKPKAQGGLT
jgi:DNA-binding LacI/PurR family transcriptional regulator